MDKNDLAISKEDLADIFGGTLEAPPPAHTEPKKEPPALKAEKPAAPAPERQKSKIIVNKTDEIFQAQKPAQSPAKENEDIKPLPPLENSVDDLIKRAQEIEKQEKKDDTADISFADFLDEKTVIEIINCFNDIRQSLYSELVSKINPKSIDNMMLRTLEKTSSTYILLRNTNWDSEGRLRMNGSIDTERFAKNMPAYRDSIQEIDKEIKESLKALIYMRLKAVKLGLGAEKYAAVKSAFQKKAGMAESGYKKSVAKFMKQEIIEPALRKVDEEK